MAKWTLGDHYNHHSNGWDILRDGQKIAFVPYRGGTEPARIIAQEIVDLCNGAGKDGKHE